MGTWASVAMTIRVTLLADTTACSMDRPPSTGTPTMIGVSSRPTTASLGPPRLERSSPSPSPPPGIIGTAACTSGSMATATDVLMPPRDAPNIVISASGPPTSGTPSSFQSQDIAVERTAPPSLTKFMVPVPQPRRTRTNWLKSTAAWRTLSRVWNGSATQKSAPESLIPSLSRSRCRASENDRKAGRSPSDSSSSLYFAS